MLIYPLTYPRIYEYVDRSSRMSIDLLQVNRRFAVDREFVDIAPLPRSSFLPSCLPSSLPYPLSPPASRMLPPAQVPANPQHPTRGSPGSPGSPGNGVKKCTTRPIPARARGQGPCGYPLRFFFGRLESLLLGSGHLWRTFGPFSIIGHHFPSKCLVCTTPGTRSKLPDLAPGSPGSPGNGMKNCTTRRHIHTRQGPGSLWMSLGIFLLTHWSPFGWLLGTCGSPLHHLLELGITFRNHVSFVPCLHAKFKLPELVPRSLGSTRSPGSPGSGVNNCTTRPHIHTRKGQVPSGCPLGFLFGPLESLWVASRHLWISFGPSSRIGHHFPSTCLVCNTPAHKI